MEEDISMYIPRPLPSKKRKKGSGTYLYVDENGDVHKVRWIRTVMYLLIFFLVISLGSTSSLYFMYMKAKKENYRLLHPVSRSKPPEKRVALKDHPWPGAKKNINSAQNTDTPVSRNTDASAADNSSRSPGKEKSGGDTPDMPDAQAETAEEVPFAVTGDDSPANPAPRDEGEALEEIAPDEEEPAEISEKELNADSPVEVEGFAVSRRSNNRISKVVFTIKSKRSEDNPVKGHALVVLQSEKGSTDEWVSLPKVSLVSGEPTGKDIGETFLISRFKEMEFSVPNTSQPGFKKAVVFVFSADNELMYKKDFTVE